MCCHRTCAGIPAQKHLVQQRELKLERCLRGGAAHSPLLHSRRDPGVGVRRPGRQLLPGHVGSRQGVVGRHRHPGQPPGAGIQPARRRPAAAAYKRTLKTVAELKESVLSLYDTWRNKFGVLLFLYSVILTKGIENIKNEIEDSTEPLIDPVYGHGSQSLINLLVTGHAVSNVWDGDRECSGMKLHGIHEQASVGFLTLMESLRYCTVGSLLKSPKFPIWILGSETHLSVFFGKEMSLVAPESPSEQARRVFQTFDPEDNGFIPDTLLEDVMKALDLVSEPEYVNLMKSKLDPEGLGIVLLGPFLLEFFPDQDTGIPDSFPVYHYNGLKQSNHDEKVSYVEGTALVLGFEDPMVRTDDTPIKRCLQTKWPYVELLWTTERSPSLN
ncbi:ubiquitin carboxyl-terminal hydrolase MINDY-3 isoform X4 [Electrophorus electricus]|uniref:ubiquitin carboxyl-terminal hydrolase MINDY-3 isoform X4 n=1 Tax=Electrophorus electricus TaxID=8005 RepID=UPI0015CFB674|nr:ubiquitin carboxyl-terminal hydrolase MINDY-3 isoform X4 [Electrophorus electricus]